MSISNRKRALRCGALVAGDGDDLVEANLIDLLADAMHWCDSNGHDFHFAFAQACRHYIHELNDDQQDERRLQP